LCEAHELVDRSLLLRCVCRRHLALATLYVLLFSCHCSIAVAEAGCADAKRAVAKVVEKREKARAFR
jgi:hypothetical protein